MTAMMYLSLVHLRELRCAECSALLAEAGARSVIVGADGFPQHFSQDDPPAEMTVRLLCEAGHATDLDVPNEIAAEETLNTPEEAPAGVDAMLMSGTTESGKPIAS